MKSLNVSALKPNSYYEKPVYVDKGYILLSPEVPVTIELIRRLNDWNYENIYSESDKATGTTPGLGLQTPPEMGVLHKTITENKIEETVKSFYTSLLMFANGIFTNFYETGEIDLHIITGKIKEINEMLKSHKNQLISVILEKKSYKNYIVSHSVNTTIISLCIAEILKFTPHRIIDLGIAALLHEIGMLKLPPQLYLDSKVLTPQEKKTLSAHTVLGYKILKNLSVHDTIAVCAIEHHERMDGSGYPRGLRNDAISLYSRIIAVACSFDGAVSIRPYKKSLDGHKAMIDLLITRKMQYDQNIVKALIYSISIFPPGTYVQLTNNTRGVVTKINPSNPKFPVVKILLNEYGEKLPTQVEIQTSTEKGLAIKHVLSEEQIKKLKINIM